MDIIGCHYFAYHKYLTLSEITLFICLFLYLLFYYPAKTEAHPKC